MNKIRMKSKEEKMNEKFTVIFYDDDRKTILDKQEVAKGETVKYQGKTPEKPAENGVQYTFVDWETTGNLMMVMENIEVYAKYEQDSKMTSQGEKLMLEMSEKNAENANLDEVMEAGQKVSVTEKATRDMSLEQKKDLVNEVMEKGSVDLGREAENERD